MKKRQELLDLVSIIISYINIVFRFSLYLDYRCDYYMETLKLILAPSGIACTGIITVKDTNLIIGEVVVRRTILVCMPRNKTLIKA
jgi:hypothetical protein